MARFLASALLMPRCSSSISVSCRPMVSTGLSEVMGSWKIMAILAPRTERISGPLASYFMRSSPSKRISPEVILPGGRMSRMTESWVTDLPQPLSPTTPTISFSWMRVADVVHGLDEAVVGLELGAQVLDFQQGGHLDRPPQSGVEGVPQPVAHHVEAEDQAA